MAKRKTESKAMKKKKKAKRLLSAPEAAARKAMKHSKANPFESIWSRKKFDIIGKKQKGEERRTGRARSLASEKRKSTLLKEYEQSRKSSAFVDKRIGENNDELGEFDKTILRLQRERQMKLKKENKYNLSDGEDEDMEQGEPFPELDDFEDIIDDTNDDGDFDANTAKSRSYLALQRTHNDVDPGPLEEENEHKTKKQIYEEIMAKSKFHKALKAKEKEEDERLAEELDDKFSSLASSDALLTSSQSSKLKRGSKQSSEGHLLLSNEATAREKADDYDKLVKEMVFDMRARPSDRTKTPEEVAREERERLEQLEEERQKRMLASDDSDDESNDHAEDVTNSTVKKLTHVSGDDLGEFVSVDEEPVKKTGWVDEILERKKSEVTKDEDDASSNDDDESNEEEGEDSEEGSKCGNEDESSDSESHSHNLLTTKDWEQSDDDLNVNEDTSLEDVKINNNEHTKAGNKDLKSSRKIDISKSTVAKIEPLPYVIEAPKDLAELCSLLDNRSASEVIEAIFRIRTCNAIKLSADNRKKIQVFYGVLLQYFAVLTTRTPLDVELLNALVKPLIEMSMDTPYFAAICARQRLIKIRTNFLEDIKDKGKSSWPSLKTLILLRLWSLTFPCSDFRHVVMTPASLLICEYLMRCSIFSARDTAVGSFLCSMVLSVAKHSHKLYPEALIFLQVLLMLSTDLNQSMQNLSQCYHFMDLKTVKPWLRIQKLVSDVSPVDFFTVMNMPVDSPYFDTDDFRLSIIFSVVETVKGFVGIYEGLSSFSEIFFPVAGILHEVLKQHVIPNMLRREMEDVAQLIIKKSNEHQALRQPIQFRKQKPVPLKLENPSFEENYVKGRNYDPDRERVEMKKLKKLLKKEAKGAVRELRKDNYFLLEAKEKDRMLMEEERAEKYGKARAFLQEQEHAFKSGQLGKGRKRGR